MSDLSPGAEPLRCKDPCTIAIFGASGDLTRRKLFPALYALYTDGLLPERLAIVGIARSDWTSERFIDEMRARMQEFTRHDFDEARWNWLAERMSYVAVTDDSEFDKAVEALREADQRHQTGGNRLFYLAIPPSAFGPTIDQLRNHGLHHPPTEGSWSRLVIEKPTGRDLPSARTLNKTINRAFDEDDVYRIDHYLGKETVQNLLVFRFANSIFEPIWNHKYIDHVQITVAESLGVGKRGGYYEEAGASRDMVQNHLFQLLCLTAMEPPVTMRPDAIRDEKVKVLEALRPMSPKQVTERTVRGQYTKGLVDGEPAIGYKEVEGVSQDSRTETYVAIELNIDNWRWADVPFYLRSGKRMAKRVSEVALTFKQVPHRLFPQDSPAPNVLILRIQPDDGVGLRFDVKVPGTEPKIKPVRLNFDYTEEFGVDRPEAYERLILDALLGDSTLFIRSDEVEQAWSFIDQLQAGWQAEDPGDPLPEYSAGTWGPTEADVMLGKANRRWRRPR